VIVHIDTLEQIDGTIVVMSGEDDEGVRYRVGIDRRIAYDLTFAIAADGPVPCYVEPWQLLGVIPSPLLT